MLLKSFYKFANFLDNFPATSTVYLSFSFQFSILLIDPHRGEGAMAEKSERLRGTGRNVLSL